MDVDVLFGDARLPKRFWNKIEVDHNDCWIWLASGNNYGLFRWRAISYEKIYVHRLTYEMFIGTIPKYHEVCHYCDVKRCCNPKHLFAAIHAINVVDAMRKHRHGNTRLSVEKIKEIKLELETDKSQYRIAKEFNVTQGTIHMIATNKRWKNI